ncbi:hypothetical protein EDB80DRAFT_714047 [Ilyonectria destructans]|nr:hypothetical protein EDB80DRAFT_714047 [Ilyonectria destructans]
MHTPVLGLGWILLHLSTNGISPGSSASREKGKSLLSSANGSISRDAGNIRTGMLSGTASRSRLVSLATFRKARRSRLGLQT